MARIKDHKWSRGRKPKSKYLLICDRTGRVIPAEEAREEWNGLVVHKSEWEPRHPQDFVRARPERIAPIGPIRPEAADTEASVENLAGYVAIDYLVDQDDYVLPTPS